ncbi:MAG: hypothetical protein MJY87_03550 [Fibrobacter sp.]|nr:hypothetical protein [Fibrobacter sp.]
MINDIFNADPEKPLNRESKNTTIFVWVDILGFSDNLDEVANESLEENASKYEKLSIQLKKFQSLFLSEEILKYADCKKLSDGIILQLKNNIRDSDSVLKFFDKIIESQIAFLKSNLYVRGGVALGTRYADDLENYISNGLSRAYKLESSEITWPIIGTNQKYLEQIKCIYDDYNFMEYFGLTYSKSGSKVFYLDPFIRLNPNDKKNVYLNILQKINEFETKPSIQQKYIWIQNTMENIDRNLISLRCPKCGESVHV